MNNVFMHDENTTPLTPDERNGLIPTHVTLRHELNELEQKNILAADLWLFQRKRTVLDEAFLRRLHKRMFSEVWIWAGTYRTTDRNIGVAPWRIQPDLRQLLDDVRYWIAHETYPPDEIAVRFHHRLVVIHPFPNGNGRWSRLAAEKLVVTLSQPRFTWGRARFFTNRADSPERFAQGSANLIGISSNLQNATTTRRAYIDALRQADKHDITALLAFARA